MKGESSVANIGQLGGLSPYAMVNQRPLKATRRLTEMRMGTLRHALIDQMPYDFYALKQVGLLMRIKPFMCCCATGRETSNKIRSCSSRFGASLKVLA